MMKQMMHAPMAMWLAAVAGASASAAAAPAGAGAPPAFKPLLFMDPATDALAPWGLQLGAPNALARNASLAPPPCNYSGGATVFAAFGAAAAGEYEVFVAVGRPGEPLEQGAPAEVQDEAGAETRRPPCPSPPCPPPPPMPAGMGVAVHRYTTVR
jgi:hypothetical protein